MKHIITLTSLFAAILLGSCEKCYDCTKKCGTCTIDQTTVAGCQGDSVLQGQSVEAWKAFFESQGYTCAYNNTEQSVCGNDNKNELSARYYECLTE